MLFLCGKTNFWDLCRHQHIDAPYMQKMYKIQLLKQQFSSWNIGLNRKNFTQSIWTSVQQHPFEQKGGAGTLFLCIYEHKQLQNAHKEKYSMSHGSSSFGGFWGFFVSFFVLPQWAWERKMWWTVRITKILCQSFFPWGCTINASCKLVRLSTAGAKLYSNNEKPLQDQLYNSCYITIKKKQNSIVLLQWNMMYNVAYLCRHIMYICENPTFFSQGINYRTIKINHNDLHICLVINSSQWI